MSALLWSSGSETLGVVFFSFQQGGDSTYAAALGVLTVAVTRRADAVDAAARAAGCRRACCHGATDDRARRQALRRVSRARRRFARRRRRRVHGDARPVGLRQDDVAAADRRLRQARCAARILIGDTRRVDARAARRRRSERRIGIVFQSYALWPHMTRRRERRLRAARRGRQGPRARARVDAALALVELEGFARRRPARAVGRPAPARGAGALPRDRAVAGAARRAARQSRRASARVDGARVRALSRSAPARR